MSTTDSTSARLAICNAVAAVAVTLVTLNACAQVPAPPYQRAGTSEAELKMQRRLIEIAEGPPPSKESIEAEFGLKYQKSPSFSERAQDFYATGHFPFNPDDAAQYSYSPGHEYPSRYSISFAFLTEQQLRQAGRSFCVAQDDLAAALIKSGWQLRKRTWPPHGIREEDYSKSLGGYSRTLSFWPLFVGCITNISIRFAELPPAPRPDSTTPSTKSPTDQK